MIFGLDLGTRRVAVFTVGGMWGFEFKLETDKQRRDYPSESDAGARMGQVLSETIGQRYGYDDHLFVYERPLVGRPHGNVKTAIGQALSAGALIAHLPGTALELAHSSLWKKDLCGNGSAGKSDVRNWLRDHEPAIAAICGESEDLHDAAGLAFYGGAFLAQAGGL